MNALRTQSRRRPAPGLTLVEVMLVLVILVIFATFAVGMFTRTQEQANIRAARAQIGMFETPLGSYHLDMNQFPSSLDGLITTPSNVGSTSKWAGPYLTGSSVPLDPWGNSYQYVAPGQHNPNTFDISSAGPDGQHGTDDDIGNWQQE